MNIKLLIGMLFLAGSAFAQTPISFSAANNNQTISTCNGFIIDSGGQGGTGYSNNENVTITLCPGTPGEIVSVVFNFFNLSTADDNPSPTQTNVDYMTIYDGTSTAANTLGTYSGNQLQGVVIQATVLNPTGCLTIQFTSNTTGTGGFTGSVSCETPCANPTAAGAIIGGITSDSIRVCVGEEVQFTNTTSSAAPGFTIVSYDWDFMDGNSATGPAVSHTFDIPGQYRVQLFVTDNNGCSNPNLIDLEVLVGTIPSFNNFPGDTTLCLGEMVTFTADPQSYQVEWNGFPGSQSVDDGCLTDEQLGVAQNIELMQTGFAAGTTISTINDLQSICLDLEHSFMGDIVVIIECPNGQSSILHQQGGGGTQLGEPIQDDNVDCDDPSTQGVPYTYCFTPTATQTWVDWADNNGFGATLPAGDYQPIEPLTNLVGCPVNGVWTLTVVDNWAADDGTLFAYSINLDPSLYPDIETFEPQIGTGADSSFWATPAPNMTYLSPNADVITITPTAAGTFTYDYFVIDNFGCEFDSTVTVTVTDNPIPNAGADIVVCDGNPVQLNGSISGAGGGSPCPFTFNLTDSYGDTWNGNHLLVTINGVTTSYDIPASSADFATYTLNIAHGTSFTVQFDGAGSFLGECSYEVVGPDGTIVLQDGGNFNAPSTAVHNLTADCFGGYEFEWSPANLVSNAAIPNPIGTFTSNGTLTLTVHPTGHPLCATTDELEFTISASAYPGEDSTLTICSQGAPEDLFPLLGPGASPNGTWTSPTNAAVTMPYNPVTMNPGPYTYQVDSNGCVSSAIITVTEINTTLTIAPVNVSCYGAANGSVVATVTNATTYTLDGGAPQAINGNTFTLTNLAPGTYTLEVNGSNGCSDQETFTITEPQPLALTDISPAFTICEGASATLQAAGMGGSSPYTYTWIANGAIVGQGTPFTVTPATTTTYCVVLSEACGSMPDTMCVTVSHPEPIVPLFVPDTTNGCFPLAIAFNNESTGGTVTSFQVDYGDGQSATLVGMAGSEHQYDNPGVYTVNVQATSPMGCVYSATFPALIEAYGKPQANFDILPNPVSMFHPTVQLLDNSSFDAVTYNWLIDSGTPSTAFTQDVTVDFPDGVAANYNVKLTVTNEHGCIDSTNRIVQVISEVLLYAPNAFTPDGNEHNQTWCIHINGIDISQYELRVFNRWGEQVWESHDPAACWDGTYRGTVMQDGVYTWKMIAKDITTDERFDFNGYVTIIR